MKILNDPIYGFITVPHPQVLALIDHPWFQRLRYIKQLGLSHLVYPGALHTRFHHALGAMHLMGKAIDVLRTKGHAITEEEALGASIAILLHDIGHGPFSHALEHSLVEGITHEGISALVMDRLNDEFGGGLEVGIRIFRENSNGKQRVKANIGNGTADSWLDGAQLADIDPTAAEWVHIALVLNPDKASLYMDGTEVKSIPFTGISWNGCDIMSIGSGAPRFTEWGHLSDQSLIDELRIYNKALPASEIARLAAK